MRRTKNLLIVVLFTVLFYPLATFADKNETIVLIETNYGNIKVKLYNETPFHKENFIELVEKGFYDSLLFHRVIKDFMIQGGDPTSKGAKADAQLGSGGPGYTIPAEINPLLFHKKGALSAARQGDNTNPMRRSSGSQFYIVQGKVYTKDEMTKLEQRMGTKWSDEQMTIYTTIGGTPFLDAQYTVFGEIIEGLDVIDKIAAVEKGKADRPVSDVIILKASIVKK